MNWLGELVQNEIGKRDMVLDLGCGTMQAILDVVPTYPKTRLKCRFILGVDIYRPYIEAIKDKEGLAVINADVVNSTDMFLDKSFDVVLLLDILEHFETEQAEVLISEAERIARRKVIIYTPSYFYDNVDHKLEHYPYCGLGDNPYQEHKSLISPDWLKECGYRVTFPEPDKNTFAVKDVY